MAKTKNPPKSEKKAKKAPKAPVEKNKKKGKKTGQEIATQDGAPKKKKKKRGLGGLILILLLLVIIAGAVVCYLYNFFDFKTMVIAFFVEQDDSYALMAADLSQQYDAIDKSWVDIEAKEAELAGLAEELIAKEAQLNSREEQLRSQDAELEEARRQLQEGTVEFEQIVETVSSMNAKTAAAMLQEFTNVNQVALVLSELEPKATAKILKEMPAGTAASITELLIYLSGRGA